MTSIIPAIKATPAVVEYQELTSLANRKISATNDMDTIRFWNRLHGLQTEKIANAYSMTVFELVDAWCAWTDSVAEARADYMAKVGA